MNSIHYEDKTYSPSKIVCIGKNYTDHIKELDSQVPDELVIFMRPNDCITDILNSHHGEQLDYEGELSFLFEDGAFTGVGFGLDLTKRTLQKYLFKHALPWERCKAFEGSALFSD